MKNRILQEFLNSDIKVISEDRLKEYIDYCFENKTDKIKGKTSLHHILPKAIFNQYKDLKKNKWNGINLSYYNHYYAHWLLTEAIDDFSQLYAFCTMHCKDLKLGRINENELISENKFKEKKELQKEKFKEWCSIVNPETGLTNAQEAVRKSYETNSKIQENGLTIYQEVGRKAHETKSKIQENGLTKYQEATNKMKETRNKVQENGKSSFENGAIKGTLTRKITICENGKTIEENAIEKSRKTLKEIDLETGLTKSKLRGLNTSKSLKRIDPETGLSPAQIGARKMAQKRKIKNKDGLSSFEISAKKLKKIYWKRAKIYNVYNNLNKIIQKNIELKELIISSLKNTSKENFYGKVDLYNRKNKKYIGWYIEYVGIRNEIFSDEELEKQYKGKE